MWKQFYELVLRGARLTEDTAENKAAIKQLQLQVEDLNDEEACADRLGIFHSISDKSFNTTPSNLWPNVEK